MLFKIRRLLAKILPEKIFTVLTAITGKIKLSNRIYKNKIKNFKESLIKDLKYKNISFKFKIYPNSSVLQDDFIFLNDTHPEIEILEIFKKHIKNNDTVLDIGTNIGHHSIFMSKCVGENGKVISFEPVPQMINRIKENIKINNIKNIELKEFALGDKEEKIKFFIDNKNDFGGSSAIKHREWMQEMEIETKKIDSLELKNIDFVKIDVEGYEWNVINGGRDTILKSRPKIVLEFSPIFYKIINDSYGKNIIDFFVENKYKIFNINEKIKEIKNYKELQERMKDLNIGQTNLLFLPEEKF